MDELHQHRLSRGRAPDMEIAYLPLNDLGVQGCLMMVECQIKSWIYKDCLKVDRSDLDNFYSL